MGLVGPDGTDRHRSQQDEAGGDHEARPQPTQAITGHCGQHGQRGGGSGSLGVLAVLATQGPATARGTPSDRAPDGLAGGKGRGEEPAQRQRDPDTAPAVDGGQARAGDVTAQPSGHAHRDPGQSQTAQSQEDAGSGHPDAPGDEQADDTEDRDEQQQSPDQDAPGPGAGDGTHGHW